MEKAAREVVKDAPEGVFVPAWRFAVYKGYVPGGDPSSCEVSLLWVDAVTGEYIGY